MKTLKLCVLLAMTMFAVATADSANAGILGRIFDRGGDDCCCEPAPCCEAPAPCCEAPAPCCEAPAPAPCPCEAAPAPVVADCGCVEAAPVDCGCAEPAPCCEAPAPCCDPCDPCCDEGRDFGGKLKGLLGGLRDRGNDCGCGC